MGVLPDAGRAFSPLMAIVAELARREPPPGCSCRPVDMREAPPGMFCHRSQFVQVHDMAFTILRAFAKWRARGAVLEIVLEWPRKL